MGGAGVFVPPLVPVGPVIEKDNLPVPGETTVNNGNPDKDEEERWMPQEL